jgi:hypothetical protein
MSTYWGWYDDDRRKEPAQKIAEAVEAYHEKFRLAPNVVLVHEADLAPYPGVTVRVVPFMRRYNFWVGWETEQVEAEPLAAA